jgi:hypothetical protein
MLWDQMPQYQGDFLPGEGRLDSHVGALIAAGRWASSCVCWRAAG